jgi:hypothetical protein
MVNIILNAFEGIFPFTVKELAERTCLKIQKVREILKDNPNLFYECGRRFNDKGLRSPETLWLRTKDGMQAAVPSSFMDHEIRKPRDRKARNLPLLCGGYGGGHSVYEPNIDPAQGVGKSVRLFG